MKRYIFIEKGIINGAGMVKQLGEDVLNIEVSEELYDDFCSDTLKYAYINGEIVRNPNYEQDKQIAVNNERAEEIYDELEVLDKKRIRAICEDEVRNERTGETWLDFYNVRINELRMELRSLGLEE